MNAATHHAGPAAAKVPQTGQGGAARAALPGSLHPPASQGRERVPETLRDAASTFLRHPSVLLVLAALAALCWRRAAFPLTPWDALVAPPVVGFWLLQEYVLHAYCLHTATDWFGRRIHEAHHAKPYFHVSIDSPDLVAGVLAAATLVWHTVFGTGGLGCTATLAYVSTGLVYLFTHYLSHTRYAPRSAWLRAVRRHHMLHHCRNEGWWFAFSVPQIDALFGTLPTAGASVAMTASARRALGTMPHSSGGSACGSACCDE